MNKDIFSKLAFSAVLVVGLSIGLTAGSVHAVEHDVQTIKAFDFSDKASHAHSGNYLQVASRNHHSRKSYRRSTYHRGGHAGVGYFVGGLIIGGILADRHDSYDNRAHARSRYDTPQQSNSTSSVYWLDKYGDCFRLESRSHGDVYVQVADRECY